MTQDWFVVREGKETGPFTAQQMKQMAATGKLAPDAHVRRSDMQAPRKASSIKGLFAAVEVAPVPVPTDATSSPPPASEISPPAATKRVPSKKTLIMASVVGGAFLFLCCGSCGIMGFIGIREGQQVKKELAEADTLWQSGKKAEAVAIYRAKKDSAFFDGNDRAVGYGRMIDYEYESGDAAGGKALIDEADKKGVTPTVNNADAKSVIVAMQDEKARIEAERKQKEEASARGEVLTADFYPYKKGMVQQTMVSLYWMKSQCRKEYTYEGDGVITIRCLKHFTVQGFNDLPLLEPTQIFHREKGGFIEIGQKLEFPVMGIDMDWRPIVKIGALAGEEWERKFDLGMTERYTLLKFSMEDVRIGKSGSPDKYLVALIEQQTKVTVSDGKIMENIEEIGLGKGIGPVSCRSFRIENGQRIRNWSETISPVVKE